LKCQYCRQTCFPCLKQTPFPNPAPCNHPIQTNNFRSKAWGIGKLDANFFEHIYFNLGLIKVTKVWTQTAVYCIKSNLFHKRFNYPWLGFLFDFYNVITLVKQACLQKRKKTTLTRVLFNYFYLLFNNCNFKVASIALNLAVLSSYCLVYET